MKITRSHRIAYNTAQDTISRKSQGIREAHFSSKETPKNIINVYKCWYQFFYINHSFIHFIHNITVMPSWRIHKEKCTNLCIKLHNVRVKNAGWLKNVIPCLLLPLKWCILIKKTSACNGICPIRHKLTASCKLVYFLLKKITVVCP